MVTLFSTPLFELALQRSKIRIGWLKNVKVGFASYFFLPPSFPPFV
jgi:hypothetical protein